MKNIKNWKNIFSICSVMLTIVTLMFVIITWASSEAWSDIVPNMALFWQLKEGHEHLLMNWSIAGIPFWFTFAALVMGIMDLVFTCKETNKNCTKTVSASLFVAFAAITLIAFIVPVFVHVDFSSEGGASGLESAIKASYNLLIVGSTLSTVTAILSPITNRLQNK